MISGGNLEKYMNLQEKYGEESIGVKQAAQSLDTNRNYAKVLMHRLSEEYCSVREKWGSYRLLDPEKWAGISASLRKYPFMRDFYKILGDTITEAEMLVLHGSRARGEAGKGSDIDLFIISKNPLKIKRKKAKLEEHNFSIETASPKELMSELVEDPLFLWAVLLEGDVIFGDSLRDFILGLGIDLEKIREKLVESLAALEKNRELAEPPHDSETKETICYSATLRLRTTFLAKAVLSEGPTTTEGMKKEFLEYYSDEKQFSRILSVYKAVRDDRKPDVRGLNITKLREYIDSVQNYTLNVMELLESEEE